MMLAARSRLSVLAILLPLAASSAFAENLFPTGQFDLPEDADAWTVSAGDGEAALAFEPWPDDGGCFDSGSALLVTSAPGPLEVQYSACVDGLVGGEQYAVGLDVFFPDGDGQGGLYWGVSWFDEPGCVGGDYGSVSVGPAGYAPGWHALVFTSSTEPEVRSARIELSVTSSGSTDPLRLYVDHVYLRPIADVFADGFEIGETCRWIER